VTSRQIRDGSLRRACSVAARHGLENTNETGVGHDAEVEGHGLLENTNETVVEDDADTEGHGLIENPNESVVGDEPEVAGHGILENTNETVVEDDAEVEAHRLIDNVNETVAEDEPEVEGHGLVNNVNETIVEDHFLARVGRTKSARSAVRPGQSLSLDLRGCRPPRQGKTGRLACAKYRQARGVIASCCPSPCGR
jgi:hypothetical protein